MESTRIKLLSFNIQAAAGIRSYHRYLVDGWRYVFPHGQQRTNLETIAELSAQHDVVGLQEIDAGSFRTGFMNQADYIATAAGHDFHHTHINRSMGRLAQHSIGFLSRFGSREITEIKLPGTLPGRGALLMRLGGEANPLIVINVHLALGKRSRQQQLEFLGALANNYHHVVLMGDFNCTDDSVELARFCQDFGFHSPTGGIHTYPSWNPRRSIDHILVSQSLPVCDFDVVEATVSDHLPVSVTIDLPTSVQVTTEKQKDIPCYSVNARSQFWGAAILSRANRPV